MVPMQESVGRRAVSGFAWTGLSQAVVQLVQFGVTIALARILFPEDFGLVGMAAVFTEAIGTLSGLALEPAVVQRRELRGDHLDTGFWTGIGVGILLFLAALTVAEPLASFYDRDVVSTIVIISAVGFVVGPAGGMHRALLTRELAFRKLTVAEIGATISSAVVSVALALLGFGPFSLVFGALAGTATSSSLMWILHPWRPGRAPSRKAFGELFLFSRSVLGNGLVGHFGANIDYLLVGRFLGAHLLGIYTLAYRLITIPLNKVSGIITRVTFPAFSLMQDDDARLQDAYTRTIRLLSLISFPALVLLGISSRDIIIVVFGQKWIQAVVPVRILLAVGMLKSVGTLVGSVVLAKGRPDLELKWNLVLLPLLGAGILFGMPYGLVGVSLGYLIVYVGCFPFIIRITNSTIAMSDRRYYGAFVPALITSLILALGVTGYHVLVLDSVVTGPGGRFVSDAAVALLAWILSLEALFGREKAELLAVARQVVPLRFRFLLEPLDNGRFRNVKSTAKD